MVKRISIRWWVIPKEFKKISHLFWYFEFLLYVCNMNNYIKDITTEELVLELSRRNLLTNSKGNELIVGNLTNENDIKVILTYGLPKDCNECRECGECLESQHFSYYMNRVDQNGYLMRSNALCGYCSKKSNSERKKVFENTIIPKKPKKGDECPHCDRKWNGNWHRHHKGDQFISWLCGHCNMSFSDQRNKNTNI